MSDEGYEIKQIIKLTRNFLIALCASVTFEMSLHTMSTQ